MSNAVKKHEFLLPFAKIFTRGQDHAFDSIPFESTESYGDETFPAMASPSTWSVEAVSVMAEAAQASVPADLRANEENTVPSWLWRHQSVGSRREAEADLRDIVIRAVGSAAAIAWKLNLFTSERHARAFYDEACYALMQRHIVIAPDVIATWGLSWAYGIEEMPRRHSHADETSASQLSNAAIDSLMGKSKNPASAPLWKKLFAIRGKEVSSVSLRLCDIAADWQSSSANPARAAIDLLAHRRDDGGINIDALRQTARILTILLDLHDRSDVTTGLANLAPVLMGAGLAYDSDAARAMAASVVALVTAECVQASSEMAALRGMSDGFIGNRDAVMRALRNHRRAVFGDGNDYEKLSVLPTPLPLKHCPDLSLLAEAQRRWNDALAHARAFGLRSTQWTDLTPSASLAVLMTSAAQGLEPMCCLTVHQPDGQGSFRTVLHPAVEEAFAHMRYTKNAVAEVTQHIVGAGTLRKGKGVSAALLKAKGFDDVALEKIEAYLPCVNSVRLAVTPWIVGMDFCVNQLKIPAAKLESPRFDLLSHFGFSDADIEAANRYCYGFGTARTAKALPLGHRPLFACGDEISTDARLRMAAAVQSFVSGDTGLSVRLPAKAGAGRGAEMTLAAWRSGLKSLTLVFDPTMEEKAASKTSVRRIKPVGHTTAKPASLSQRRSIRKEVPSLAAKKSAGKRGAQSSRNSK